MAGWRPAKWPNNGNERMTASSRELDSTIFDRPEQPSVSVVALRQMCCHAPVESAWARPVGTVFDVSSGGLGDCHDKLLRKRLRQVARWPRRMGAYNTRRRPGKKASRVVSCCWQIGYKRHRCGPKGAVLSVRPSGLCGPCQDKL